jgi:hypothetical protein
MAEKNKKYNRPAGIKPRNKHTHAQYVWVREMFLRQDALDARLKRIEEFLGFERNLNKEGEERQGGGTP